MLFRSGLDVVAARLWKEIFGWEAEVWLCCWVGTLVWLNLYILDEINECGYCSISDVWMTPYYYIYMFTLHSLFLVRVLGEGVRVVAV